MLFLILVNIIMMPIIRKNGYFAYITKYFMTVALFKMIFI
ncbi:hypothetical protein XBKQ1_1280040 [Xenorhabdus bovienii str. kraussei Quebec]|uniref:Uncharacterized protein n=2 Tax=Xenorhabdus bovienii TaxID=40576 RepID=A0A077PFM4_XENBV|nr:hypothetical protein XBKQ1_1280040 [Xenorhabdus bovienii str. kraussei Quebec]CDH32138.1 hypothetical protein XBI1_1870104 [Xenorhabdus bovienii str. Intermedium]